MSFETPDLWERITQGVATEIRGLDLVNPTEPLDKIGSKVYVQTLPDENALSFPCVVVTVEGETEELTDAYFGGDEIMFPVRVLVCDRADTDYQSRRPLYLSWRRQIAQHLQRLMSLPRVPECFDVQVTPQLAIDPKLPQYQYLVSGLRVKVYTSVEATV